MTRTLALAVVLAVHAAPPLGSNPETATQGVVPLRTVRGIIPSRATLASVLSDYGPATLVHKIVTAARPVYDLAHISVGRPFGIALGPDGLLRAFSYGIDDLQTLHVTRRSEGFRAEMVTRRYQPRTAVIGGVIETSLFGAVAAAGESDELAMDLADVFAWDVDFNTELQRGDSFRAVVEKLYLDGRLARYGRIQAAELVRGERTLRAFYHEGADGGGYYDADGRALRKAFLRSPLRFTRISSRFSRSRLHPILRQRRPHLGVDYAAPTGTPVHAAADGVVVTAGWLGGYGKTVRVRHANGYETLYGHLSRIDVVRGRRVSQGMRLGAVGATGLATGPHLDYRMVRNDKFVDPLRVVLPPAPALARGEREAFRQSASRFAGLLSTAPLVAAATGAGGR